MDKRMWMVVALMPALGGPVLPMCPDCDWKATIDDVSVTSTGWTVKVAMQNVGTASLPGCWTDVYLDLTQPPGPGQLSPHYAWTPPLAAGETAWLEVDVPAGDWVDVKVDSTEVRNEYDESNNLDVFHP